ncbi:MAG TPA: hypothetical protein VML91_08645 [Burkholderiales bacterium]|nr:hypothetical protein [Burkholderiales bacterium]
MTPQSQFIVLAPVTPGREHRLRGLLATMNSAPGMADPANAVLPFGQFERLHFARLAVLDDPTLGDIEAHGVPRSNLPVYLALTGSCDGPADECIADLARRAGMGLRRIFAHCDGFDAQDDLAAWMQAHRGRLAADYVNWVGRTVRQVKEESALRRALAAKVARAPLASGAQAQQLRRELIDFVDAEVSAGRLGLTPPDPTPLRWQLAKLLHLLAIPLAGLVLLPFLIVLSPLLIYLLRTREKSDAEIYPPPDRAALLELQQLEDHDVSNQYTAIGSVKPGLFRRWLVSGLLVLIDYAARHVFTRGFLARVQTIHFAFWAFLDDKRRLVFTSNYDGGHEAYMDDFINKVAWGLNLSFSHGVGWPRTRWLVARGARIENKFKNYQRRHQLPTEVWYKAYPGLALADLERNQRIREGLEPAHVTDAQAEAWLRLL